jgi:hypothetical protein
VVLFLFLSMFAHAQPPAKRHLYVEWRYHDQIVVLGRCEGPQLEKIAEQSLPASDLTAAYVERWLGPSGGGVLLFFHAMWGQEVHFRRHSQRAFDRVLAGQPDSGIQTVITFIWPAGGLLYNRNWTRAAGKGEPLGPLLAMIAGHYAGRTHVFCHSMGNRFFQGMLRTARLQELPLPGFASVVLFSPDLNAAADDPDLERLVQASRRVALFVHRRDRILLLSSWMHRGKRLGRSGPLDASGAAVAGAIEVIDMTGSVGGLHNHTHLGSRWAQERLAEVWAASTGDFSRRKSSE